MACFSTKSKVNSHHYWCKNLLRTLTDAPLIIRFSALGFGNKKYTVICLSSRHSSCWSFQMVFPHTFVIFLICMNSHGWILEGTLWRFLLLSMQLSPLGALPCELMLPCLLLRFGSVQSSGQPPGFPWFPLSALSKPLLKAVIWDNLRAQLVVIGFFPHFSRVAVLQGLVDYCPDNNCSIFFCIFLGRRINLIPVTSSWKDVKVWEKDS